MAKVYFSEKNDKETIKKIAKAVFEEQELDGKIAVKVHFGEKGNTRFVQPEEIKPIIEALDNENFFFTDTNTLYVGKRTNDEEHKKLAKEHGFSDWQIKIASEETEVEINKPIFKKVKIGKEIAEADSLLVISHFKGHVVFGFGGAIKNIGMGSGTRAGKLEMHSNISPSVGSGCKGCGTCVEHCPADAITIEDGKAKINSEKCIGCADCIAVCPYKAVNIPWGGAVAEDVRKRAAEYAFGAAKDKKTVYINFIIRVTKDCDCLSDSEIIGKDVGIAASLDPVALDKASYDLCIEKNGKDVFKEFTGNDGTNILDYGEEIGLGKKEYELIRI
jgi:uncharacterized protein